MRFGSHARWGDFNGTTQYLQLPDANDLSVTSRGRLTIEARIRPDTLPFPSQEGSGYVYLLGKGARQTSTSKSPGCTPDPTGRIAPTASPVTPSTCSAQDPTSQRDASSRSRGGASHA